MKIEDLLNSPSAVNFVRSHQWFTWALLTVLISMCLLVPILLTWPKSQKK